MVVRSDTRTLNCLRFPARHSGNVNPIHHPQHLFLLHTHHRWKPSRPCTVISYDRKRYIQVVEFGT